MITLHLDLADHQAQALSRLVKQIPAHHIREWAGDDQETEAMRQALDVLRKALDEPSV